ncbi:hypothetical protein RM545_09610 [Zunongwangia sp. F260]|uniref:Uncharacterized protein n=1 Tax=Autumnicola lenta TaxID=3075593 RepID=A0ABU3CL34_9FLAO|nr:hypothetical protein [Zunongwangia sp. F260]MDT0646947.1 hypothetical protein [Zunongwangia sp. F260]
MHNYHPTKKDKQLSLSIPGRLLTSKLTLNQKYILGLDFSLNGKLGYNSYSHKEVGKLIKLHPNIVGSSRKVLIEQRLLEKNGRKYFLTQKALEFLEDDKAQILLPFDLYTLSNVNTGAKLLWGVYNFISRGFRDYFALRETTAAKMGVSVGSITNWTKELNQERLLKMYEHRNGYCTSQTVVVTCTFIKRKVELDLNREKDHNGNWRPIMPLINT